MNFDPTQKLLQKLFVYDAASGFLLWRERGVEFEEFGLYLMKDIRLFNSRFANTRAGTLNPRGYREVKCCNKSFPEHRLIWLLQTGFWPDTIDHINGIKDDNRWINLRSVTINENAKNKPLGRNNKTGQLGITKRAKYDKWRARINSDGKRVNLGDFDSFEEALLARKKAEIDYGYHKNHGRRR